MWRELQETRNQAAAAAAASSANQRLVQTATERDARTAPRPPQARAEALSYLRAQPHSPQGESSRPQANPEDSMSIIAQMSPAQYAQMREQMLGEQMLEQLNQLSPPPYTRHSSNNHLLSTTTSYMVQ